MQHFRITTDGLFFRIETAKDRWWTAKLKWKPIDQCHILSPPPRLAKLECSDHFPHYGVALARLDAYLQQGSIFTSWYVPDLANHPPLPTGPNPFCVDGCLRHRE